MVDEKRMALEGTRTWARLMPRFEAEWADTMAASEWATFRVRLETHFPQLFRLLMRLYGDRYDFYYHLEQILAMAASLWCDRPANLKALDATPRGGCILVQSQQMLGGVCYRYLRR